jgi:hypothetical protein
MSKTNGVVVKLYRITAITPITRDRHQTNKKKKKDTVFDKTI